MIRSDFSMSRPRNPIMFALVAASAGMVWLAAVEAMGGGAAVPWSLIATSLLPEMLLPILGLGIALGLLGGTVRLAALVLLGLGVVGGIVLRHEFLSVIARLPHAATHQFLTGPIAGLAVGIVLLAPRPVRSALTPVAAFVVGAMLAVAVKLLDPSLRDPHLPWLAGLSALALMLGVAAIVSRIRHPFMLIAARILGSWVLAVAFLYGGATLATRGRAVVPEVRTRMEPSGTILFPDLERQAAP